MKNQRSEHFAPRFSRKAKQELLRDISRKEAKHKEAPMKLFAIALTALTLTACAGAGYRPMVDSRGSPGNYEQDLVECQDYARQVAGAGERAVVGAVIGALLGAALGHKTGWGRDFARAGALGGALGGAEAGESNQQDIIRRCMAGRGYNVLN